MQKSRTGLILEPYISAKESDIESDGSTAAEEVEEDGEEN